MLKAVTVGSISSVLNRVSKWTCYASTIGSLRSSFFWCLEAARSMWVMMRNPAPAEGDYLANVIECPLCGERWCLVCETHWADCSCPGPEGAESLKISFEGLCVSPCGRTLDAGLALGCGVFPGRCQF